MKCAKDSEQLLMAKHYLLFLSVLLYNGYHCSSLEIELGNKSYQINFTTLPPKEEGDRVEILCNNIKVQGQNITWYFIHQGEHPPYTPNLYPFSFCQVNCELDNGKRKLTVKEFHISTVGNYICVDGENGHGYYVYIEEKEPEIKQLPFDNQTASIGTNVTFSCNADTGRPNKTQAVDYMNVSFLDGERCKVRNECKKSNMSKRIENGRVIVSMNLTLMSVRKGDLGIKVECRMFDVNGMLPILTAWLLEKDSPTIEDKKVDVKILLPVLASFVIVSIILAGIIYLCHPPITYWIFYRHNLPERGDKSFHGLILYNEDAEVYDKVQRLKSGLHGYNLREYPPGPDSADQQAGYLLATLLDTMCQECACVIIVGEVGDLEERCLSTFKGREVTHIILSGSQDKKINQVFWPKETSCDRNRKWRNFIFRVKKGLPKLDRRGSNDPEEQMLTRI
ncbi:uncharacterized protein LOC127705651 [Mytilus californianus]|uniref:uncharacterized protein LOC127705651 n=1 Tax=Mytilus californianus TaxID=6549 RepID=UPI002246D805|nr:uncharacterized protein LOC127705651 [Mytilus californianus]